MFGDTDVDPGKLDWRYAGPFLVTEKVNNNSYKVRQDWNLEDYYRGT